MKKLLLLMLLVGFALPAFCAGEGNVKLSLWDRYAVSIPHNNLDEIKGVDLGIGSTTHNVTGFQGDLLWAETNNLIGANFAWGISKTSYAQGAQLAFVTMSNSITGAQLGAVNMSSRSVIGAQVGFYNQAEYINGVQLGFVNYAKYIYGLQLGFINIAENGFLPAMIFVNGRF
ncbi:MAG: hypothetical protein J6Y25_03575 [Elusimicrobiaceae bacterium]|nr:hypothetical protein [Elusimicrobiaceae bacterium]MBP5616599.1 hypothetical protein [Elusimicrobiaceae bacterium]